MGSLAIPASGRIYLDANCVIYSVEKHPDYWPLLLPLWQVAQSRAIEVVSSELVLLETLVVPYRSNDSTLAHAYEQLFLQPQTCLLPITKAVLRQAAQLRATTSLRTPDAIHAATAIDAKCVLMVSNDQPLRRIAGLSVVILRDLLLP